MKKIKRYIAMFLACAMVLGMTMAASAATIDKANIEVTDADNATLQLLQVIEPNTTSETGWGFTDDEYAGYYIDAFTPEGGADITAQEAIAMLIRYQIEEIEKKSIDALSDIVPSIIGSVSTPNAAQINQALDNVINGAGEFADMNNPEEVEAAGIYVIKATEDGYTYKAMAAYVGFGTVTGGDYPSLADIVLAAKKIPTNITKTDNDADDAVAIGQTVEYTIRTAFPYFNKNEENKSFKISDEISGAEYSNLNEGATVVIGSDDVTEEITFAVSDNGFEVDLTAFIDDENTNAGKEVVITYEAVIDDLTTTNTPSSHISDSVTSGDSINLYTGKITFTKYNEDSSEELAGAGFEVTKGDEVLTFTQNGSVYTYDPDGSVTEVFTGDDGTLVVQGLDVGTYTFTEKTAPKGYSINEEPTIVELAITDDTDEAIDETVTSVALGIFSETDDMVDTRLLALPSTGGIGTTIFIVAGCGIMIAAAFFFFVSRKKKEE